MKTNNEEEKRKRTWSAPDSVAVAWIFLACSNSAGNGMSSIFISPIGKEN
jgi:hypothetical protein